MHILKSHPDGQLILQQIVLKDAFLHIVPHPALDYRKDDVKRQVDKDINWLVAPSVYSVSTQMRMDRSSK